MSGVSALALASGSSSAFAQKKYDDGVTDTEIKIGNTNPYSGPASSYAAIARTIDAYFKAVNETGGINGRKIRFISMDDGYVPSKTVEVVRQMVESAATQPAARPAGSCRQMRPEPNRIVVVRVERDPGDGHLLPAAPGQQEQCLPVAGRCCDHRQRRSSVVVQRLQQPRSTKRSCPRPGPGQLRFDHY